MSYAPYLPLNTLKPVDDGLWTVDGPEVSYDIAGVRIACPTRMTVFLDGRGRIMLHSPTQFDAYLAEAVATLGPVTGIIAPNSFHYLSLGAWADHFHQAAVFAAPVMPRSVNLPARTQTLTNGAFCKATDVHIVDGGAWAEGAFFHKPTGTVILTDLLQNFELARVKGTLASALLWCGGAAGNPLRASIEMRLAAIFAGKRRSLRKDFAVIKAWNPNRVLIAHGKQPEGPTAGLLERGFAWA